MADLRASYLLVSRRLSAGTGHGPLRRLQQWRDATRTPLTLAAFWTPVPKLSVGLELCAGGGEQRGLADLRYRFAGP